MIMQAKSDDGDPTIARLFPQNEGKTKTLGVNLPPSIAAAIRRRGNMKKSISDEIISLIDPTKLAALLRADAEHQARCNANK